jgi:hypothetical protein
MPSSVNDIIINLIKVDSIWSIVIRAVIWLVLISIFAYGAAKNKSQSRVRAEAGFFLLFIILTGVTLYLVFGIIPTVSSAPSAHVSPFR